MSGAGVGVQPPDDPVLLDRLGAAIFRSRGDRRKDQARPMPRAMAPTLRGMAAKLLQECRSAGVAVGLADGEARRG